MLKTISNSVASRYHLESYNDITKIIVLHLFMLLGVATGIVLFTRDLFSFSSDECLPGDISILVIFGFGLYSLVNIHIDWSVKSFFLIPIVPYFFFISNSYAIYPNQLSLSNTLWFLVPFFLFFLIFSTKKRDLTIYFILSFLTILLHSFLAGLSGMWFELNWQLEQSIFNPFITLTLFYLVSLVIAWNFQNTIDNLVEQKDNTEQLVNQTVRNLPLGMMLFEIVKDEFETPSHLIVRRTNVAFERQFRITSREIKGQKADDVLPKIFRESFDWNKQFLKSKMTRFEFHLDRLNKYFEVDSFKLNENQIVCLFKDISAKQNKIINLEENKIRYQVLLEAIPDLFFIIDKEGIYVDFVFKATEALKIKPDDIIGNSIFEVGFSEKMANAIFKCINVCIETDSIETIEYALEVEGVSAMFEMRIARLNDHSVISLARDISQRKLAEIKLEEAKQKAEESDRLKTAFLANISHEIRTPMNAIIGFSKMVGSSEFDDIEKKKFVEIIIMNGKVLLTLINDMISLSKIESNTLVLKNMPCKVNDMMVNLYKDYGYELEDRQNIKLKIRCENTNPKFSIITDPVLLLSVMIKLIDNAIKFTEQGEVEFGYRVSQKNHLEFFVNDSGIGIAERDQERIFERFHQLDNRTTRAYEGTGIGLSIAQHYVRLLGGNLNVKSKLGKGSSFSFSIPNLLEQNPLKIIR
ncbi:MAG: ATP-binding protein [Prolixibacteraceae bacterium]